MLNCFQVLDPDYSMSVTLVWMLDCFRFQIQISHFSVDVGLFQVSDPDQSLYCGCWIISGFRSRLLNISHFSVDVGLFQVLDPDYTTSVTLVWMLDCFRF